MNSVLELLLSPLGSVVLMVAVGATLVLFVLTRSDTKLPDTMNSLREEARKSSNSGLRRGLKQKEERHWLLQRMDRFITCRSIGSPSGATNGKKS